MEERRGDMKMGRVGKGKRKNEEGRRKTEKRP
jgi:hypothetical protein